MHTFRLGPSIGRPRCGPGRAQRCNRRRQHGFTLIELIIAAGLIGLLAKTATMFWVDGIGLARSMNTDSAAVADGRATLERLAREIREVKYNTTNGAYCVSTLGATQMVFNKTSGSVAAGCGGATPTAANNDIAVTVAVAGSTVNLTYTGTLVAPLASPTTKALTNTASLFTLAYFRADGTTAATGAGDVRFVRIDLTQRPTGGQATPTRTVVALRNN